MYFEIIDEIANIETIAIGRSIREIEGLRTVRAWAVARTKGDCHSQVAK
jgi:hypothetical protein